MKRAVSANKCGSKYKTRHQVTIWNATSFLRKLSWSSKTYSNEVNARERVEKRGAEKNDDAEFSN